MVIDVQLIITVISIVFGIYGTIKSTSRNEKTDTKADATQLTTVIVKLENIGTGVTEIKAEMNTIKSDMKDNRERVIKMEVSNMTLEQRIKDLEQDCKLCNKKGATA